MRASVAVLALAGLLLTGCGGDPSPREQAELAAATARADGLPDLVGKTRREAAVATNSLGLDLRTRGGDCDTCIVVRQTPQPGAILEDDDDVTVTVLTGKGETWYGKHRRMPKLVGMSEDEAERLLKPILPLVESESKPTSKLPAGKPAVVGQSPKAGKPLKTGQKIRLTVGYNPDDAGTGSVDDPGVNVDNHDGETRFCRGKWWC